MSHPEAGSEAPDSAPAEATPPAPELSEYQTSGRRFVRWNAVTLVLGLVALAVGFAMASPRPVTTSQGVAPTASSTR